jgi:signal transduction histidine kinase
MRLSSSLTNRIFLACTLLATVSLGFAFTFVNAQVTGEVEAELQRDLAEAGTLVDQRRAAFTETFTTMTRLIADLPKLTAAVSTRDAPTVQPLADQYRSLIDADALVIHSPSGAVLARSGVETDALMQAARAQTADGSPMSVPHPRGLLQVVSAPIIEGGDPTNVIGLLTVGFFLDDRRAVLFKAVTGTEIAFAAGGRVLAASLPPEARGGLNALTTAPGGTPVSLRGEEYIMVARPFARAGEAADPNGPTTLILRSRTERLRYLSTLRAGLSGALIVTLLLATVLSYAVARTMTRPLAAVTDAMRDVAATGDLTRKVTVQSRAWDDEDARLLGSTFNTLTESIARFQREAAQRERLSSLGRMSTVIAHEVRNPLMIIRASLSSLRADRVSARDVREAVADIDEETQRINRIVGEVLDFAKPIRFDFAEANVNDVCRASVAAAWAGDSPDGVHLDLDPAIPPFVTDAERLRTVLVNILANARHAVQAVAADRPRAAAAKTSRAGLPPSPSGLRRTSQPGQDTVTVVIDEPTVVLRTQRHESRVVISVSDRGVGVSPEDLPHVFDPYYTTRRSGTGLGLPIAKNIIEGLGGTISVTSRLAEGTDVRIDLPVRNVTPA